MGGRSVVTPVPATELDKYLPHLEWHLEQFSGNGQFLPEDIVEQIRSRERQLWIVWDGSVQAAMLTSVLSDRLDTVQVAHCCGRDMAEWLHLWPVIEAWAVERGAKRIEAVARPGWERILKRYGMKKTHVVLEKRL